MVMEEDVKRWTARRKSALVLEIIQGKTTVAEAARAYDLTPSEIEEWVDQGKAGMENALRAKPEDIREQYERQLKELQEAYGEAMLELRRKMRTGCCYCVNEFKGLAHWGRWRHGVQALGFYGAQAVGVYGAQAQALGVLGGNQRGCTFGRLVEGR